MSINCINCVVNARTGHDLLCDECRRQVPEVLSELRQRADSVAKIAEIEGRLISCEMKLLGLQKRVEATNVTVDGNVQQIHRLSGLAGL